jgi:hypothetical protein
MQGHSHVLAAAMFAACASFGANLAQAQDKGAPVCSVTTTRTACPGKEAESYKKCDGKKSCSKNVEAASADACVEAATASCSNDRLEITKSKTITVKWNGQPVKSKSGKEDVCLDYPKRAAEFDQCPAKK